eukprot:TRINITY_DN2860_c0_g1_i2.p1 TRINITY_DN2860_c0_g1~~TRINITY_DN2860_c0_g1_i2.p1  ORF type:complete len:869 (-),score=335.35 TRINITY_DN2860_c0_g1_i2:171-2777(-)
MQVMNGFVQQNIPHAQTFMSKVSTPFVGKLPTPTITQSINLSAFSRGSKDINSTLMKSDISALGVSYGRQADILSDVKTIHGYLSKYYDKMAKASAEDEDLDIPLDEMKASIEEMQEVAGTPKKLDPLPFADYMGQLTDKGAVKIDSESSFDQYWVQQQQAQSLYSGEDETDILNEQSWDSPDPKRDLCDIMSDILKEMLNIYVKYEGKWSAIRKSEDYAKVKLASSELRSISFDQECPYPSLLTFWINAYNCLMIHIHIHVGPPTNKILRKIFFRDFCYLIGDFKFSLRDIRDGILRANPKGKITRHRLIRSFDLRRSLVLSHFDPRIHFALSLLNHATPIVRLYSPSTIEEQLQFSGEAFMNKHLQIGFGSSNKGKEEVGASGEIPLVTLPVMIEKNASDFGLKMNSKDSQCQLFIWLFQFLNTKKRLDLMIVLESKEFLLNFEENTWETMNVRQSIRLTKKNINNLIHESQMIFRCICLDMLHVETVEDILSVGKSVHSISSRLRDCKDSYIETFGKETPLTKKFSIANTTKDRHFLNFVGLSKEQKASVPDDKHAIFLDILKKILLEVERIIANLSIFILENGFGENTDLLVQLNVIAREARVLDERLHSIPSFEQKEVPSVHKNIFMLIQATSSEMGDVANVIKILDKEISDFVFEEPSSPVPPLLGIGRRANSVGEIRKSSLIGVARMKRDAKQAAAKDEKKWALQSILDKQTLLLTIGIIMRYIRSQLEVDTKKIDMLPPFEPQSVVTEGLYSIEKLRELQSAIGHSLRIIYTQIDSFLEQLSAENSTKQILLLATKARNIRNALRHLKGKKLKLVMGNLAMLEGSDSRLTIRMINASTRNRELDNELAEEDLQILERLLL